MTCIECIFCNMKNKDKISRFRFLINLLAWPLLVLHETMHIITALLLFRRISYVHISSPREKEMGGIVYTIPYNNTFLGQLIFSLSPVFIFFIPLFLIPISYWFLLFYIYLILMYDWSLPSEGDIVNAFYFKIREKETDEANILLYDIFEDIRSEKRFDLIFNREKIIKILEKTKYEYETGIKEIMFI